MLLQVNVYRIRPASNTLEAPFRKKPIIRQSGIDRADNRARQKSISVQRETALHNMYCFSTHPPVGRDRRSAE